jgi:hypothetical protein
VDPAGVVTLHTGDADARLRELAASRAAARPVLGALAAALVGSRLHEVLGYRSLGDYGRERLGVGARVLREWARVWRRLEGLPKLRAAVLRGEVSWSAARLVAALARRETEGACLETIRGRTLRAVEAIVRAFREAEQRGPAPIDGEEDSAADRVAVWLACTRREAALWAIAVELARRTAGEELAEWECAEAIAAEAASAWGAASAGDGRGPDREPDAAAPDAAAIEPGERHRAFPEVEWPCGSRGLPKRLAALAHDAASCSAREIDGRLREVIAFLQTADFETGHILQQMQLRGAFAELGFAGLDRYAAERLDLSASTAGRLIALARAGRGAPEVARAYRDGRIHAFQARAIARVATPATARAWVERAREVSLRRLEAEVEASPREFIAFRAPPAVAILFRAMLARAGCLERLLMHAIDHWSQQGALFEDYADFERDGWRCTVPGCTARRNLQSHHIRYRSAGGPDEPWNRTTLCAHHHQRSVHGGTVRIRGVAPDGLVFELGSPEGERYFSGDVLFSKAAMVCSVPPMRPAARG